MRVYLMLCLTVCLLLGCKKEDEEPVPQTTEELVKGEWNVINERYEYYNTSNRLVFATQGISVLGGMSISGQTVTENHSTGTLQSGTYSITEIDGLKYITIEQGNGTTWKYEIVMLKSKEMIWARETSDGSYHDGTTMQPSARTLLYIVFKRKYDFEYS